MKLTYPIVCALLAGLAFAEPAVLQSKKTPVDVAPTANPESPFWRDLPAIIVTADSTGKPVPNNRMEVRSRWSSDNLYILFICEFDELTLKSNPTADQETNKLWEWDVAEAFIGSDAKDINRYKEFEVSPQREWVDLDIDRSPMRRGAGIAWNSGFEVNARIDRARKTWYGEMKIPLQALDVKSRPSGTKLRLGVFRCAGREPNRKLMSWQNTGVRNFHVPERFGILELKD